MRPPRHWFILFLLVALEVCGAEPRGGPAGIFRTDVPDEPFNLILGRPTRTSVAISILTSGDADGYLRYGAADAPCTNLTETFRCRAREPHVMAIKDLSPDTSYRYVFCHRVPPSAVFQTGTTNAFHTQRPPGAAVTFTITADSHLDENTDPAIYAQTLRNASGDRPDFHIDLGDTFMTGKRRDRPQDALPQYLAQRHYFGLLCSAAPLFLALGNHDGETGRSLDVAARMRTAYFPNPCPDGFYEGSASGNYYAWHWGDALFIVLDPFRYSTQPARGEEGGGWSFTLGRPQYDWLQSTLERSTARFKFVFIHHLVGGRDRQGRGGAEAVPLFEWGGHELDGRDTFATNRPGWPMPVHALLREHGVIAVFHGHDHFYARQEAGGIIYQLVPQPGHPGDGSIGCAREYGYTIGGQLSGTGYLRVTVSDTRVAVAFVRTGTIVPAAETYTITTTSR
jgi:hypothetical protein